MEIQLLDQIPAYVMQAMKLLEDKGYQAYLVGGCLRDLLLGMMPHDYDMASDATPEEILKVFKDYPCHKVGAAFGTVGVLFNDQWLEITTFRKESEYSDHRRPDSVAFSKSLTDDLQRRDFRINAMAWSRKGLRDPFSGREDLAHKRITAVGKARDRFTEDPLRILRGLRLSASLGFTLERETLKAMEEEVEGLKYISQERIRQEIFRLISSPHSVSVIKNHYSLVFYNFKPLLFVRREVEEDLAEKKSLSDDPLVSMGYILSFVEKEEGKNILKQLVLSAKEEKTISMALESIHWARPKNDVKLGQCLRQMGWDQLYYWSRLKDLKENTSLTEKLEKSFALYQEKGGIYHISQLAIGGSDVMALGYQGKDIGDALDRALDLVIREVVDNEKVSLLNVLKEKKIQK